MKRLPFDKLSAQNLALRARNLGLMANRACVIMDGVGESLRQRGVSGPMHMYVARVHSLPTNAGWVGGEADRLTIHQPSRCYAPIPIDRGAVELVTGQPSPSSRQELIMIGD